MGAASVSIYGESGEDPKTSRRCSIMSDENAYSKSFTNGGRGIKLRRESFLSRGRIKPSLQNCSFPTPFYDLFNKSRVLRKRRVHQSICRTQRVKRSYARFPKSYRADAGSCSCATLFKIFVALPYVIADRVAIMKTALFFSIVEAKRSEARPQPGLKALLHACDERQNGLAPEGAIGLGVIAERVVAGQARQQRRDAEGERFLPSFPIEAMFLAERPSRPIHASILETLCSSPRHPIEALPQPCSSARFLSAAFRHICRRSALSCNP
ncbi:MAG: hypothetical protein FD172_1535 [Methylocystaceae bacterium]|nr:MAG: hypothetical protein FD172_1535 [Methylocystaceae bacterium]